jgi:TrmH family RNA methyltransferase
MVPEIISSPHNDRIKHLRRLRNAQGSMGEWFVLEGKNLVREAIQSGWEIESVYAASGEDLPATSARCFQLTERALQSVSTLKHAPGVLAVARKRLRAPQDVSLEDRALLLDGVQDPGNVGTLLRSAAAFGVSVVLSSAGTAHFYQSKVVRGAMGALFHLQLAEGAQPAVVGRLLLCHQSELLVADSHEGEDPRSLPPGHKCMLVLGNEAAGISSQWRALPHRKIRIPLAPAVDSLNVAVAGAILLYELSRPGAE